MCDYQDYVHKAMEQNAMSFDEADDLWLRDIDNLEIAKDHKGKNGTLRLAWKIEESCANHGAKRPATIDHAANLNTNTGATIEHTNPGETNLNTNTGETNPYTNTGETNTYKPVHVHGYTRYASVARQNSTCATTSANLNTNTGETRPLKEHNTI
jgi:hypothetical protein